MVNGKTMQNLQTTKFFRLQGIYYTQVQLTPAFNATIVHQFAKGIEGNYAHDLMIFNGLRNFGEVHTTIGNLSCSCIKRNMLMSCRDSFDLVLQEGIVLVKRTVNRLRLNKGKWLL